MTTSFPIAAMLLQFLQASVPYEISYIGPFTPRDINDSGTVVGGSYIYQEGSLHTINQSLWSGVNQYNVAVGTMYGSCPGSGVVWAGSPQCIPQLATNGLVYPLRINDAGQVIGNAMAPGADPSGRSLQEHAFLFSDHQMIDLTPDWTDGGTATSINNRGQILLESFTNKFEAQAAFLWDKNVLTPIGNWSAYAGAINNQGQIVGHSEVSGYYLHATLWDHGTAIDLGTLPSNPNSEAVDINDLGQVIGYAHPLGFLWENGQMTNLLDLIPAHSGWTYLMPQAINNHGQIAGYGIYQGSTDWNAFLMTPVPEPSALFCVAWMPFLLVPRAHHRIRRRDRVGSEILTW